MQRARVEHHVVRRGLLLRRNDPQEAGGAALRANERRLRMTRLVMQLLKTRWGVIILAPIAAAVGVIALLYTTPAHYARIDGTVASYTVVHNAIGQYDHNELRLAGDPAVYKLDDGEYSPAPPDALPAGAAVSIWVDQGHPWIMAMTVAGASGS